MPRCRAAAAPAKADVKALRETHCRLYWPQPRMVASTHLCPLRRRALLLSLPKGGVFLAFAIGSADLSWLSHEGSVTAKGAG